MASQRRGHNRAGVSNRRKRGISEALFTDVARRIAALAHQTRSASAVSVFFSMSIAAGWKHARGIDADAIDFVRRYPTRTVIDRPPERRPDETHSLSLPFRWRHIGEVQRLPLEERRDGHGPGAASRGGIA